MKNFSIIQKATGKLLDHGNFEIEADGHIWFQPMIDRGVYGQKEIPERKELMTVLVKEAVIDEVTGEELEPAIFEEQEVVVQEFVPAKYEIVITDVTDELALQQEKAEARQFLAETDWMVLKYLRHQALGRDPSMTEEEYLALELQRQAAADKL